MTRLRLIGSAAFLALALALTAVAAPGGHAGHAAPSSEVDTDLSALWAVPPVEVAAILVGALLYVLAVRRAGVVLPAWRRASVAAGFGVLLVAVTSPLGGAAQQGLLSAHMLQHTLIGALAPLLLLLGVPRELAERMIGTRARARLARLQHPALAFPLWTVGTVVWLLPAVHHAVLVSPPLWIFQQVSFLVLGALLWAPVLEAVPAPRWFGTAWKGGYMTGVFFVGLLIANVYWFSGTAFYDSHAEAAAAWGVSALNDQANAGTVMMVLHCLLAFGATAVLFFRQAREGDLRQRLIEAGVAPPRAEAAIRAGAGEALARRVGVSVRSRPGID